MAYFALSGLRSYPTLPYHILVLKASRGIQAFNCFILMMVPIKLRHVIN